MSSTITETAAAASAAAAPAVLKLRGGLLDPSHTYGDFRDQLARQGWVVVKRALDPAVARQYAQRAHAWLEEFDIGYKRDDPATWKVENLPTSFKGGLYNMYGVGYEQFLWDLRTELGVVEPFSRIWGTEELLVSTDGVNISIPVGKTEGEVENKPWPHVDQSPTRLHLHCIQGIVNLHPNGPRDGGLKILKGSRELYAQMWEAFDHLKPEGGWDERDVYVFNDDQIKWFEDHGCQWMKIEADPGDLILWDSRTCHYGAMPEGENFRIAAYVCYRPASDASPADLAEKVRAIRELGRVSHDPIQPLILPNEEPPARNGVPDRAWGKKKAPLKPAFLSERALKLAGLKAY